MNDEKIKIFASKDKEGVYRPEEIISDWEHFHSGFEYGDVKESEYQVWEYPSGKIFDIIPDREVNDEKEYYTTPYTTEGTMWLPKLEEAGIDTKKVTAAYIHLKNHKKGRSTLAHKLADFFRKSKANRDGQNTY